MRFSPGTLKDGRLVADFPCMTRGMRVRRSVLPIVIAIAVLPGPGARASTAPAGGGSAVAGEPGSGPPLVAPTTPRTALTRAASVRWSDVPGGYWARPAINYVGSTYAWMRDYPTGGDGETPFKPNRLETRKLLARAAVRAFAPGTAVDPKIRFDDLAKGSKFYPFANVAVQLGWMRRTKDATGFSPGAPVTTRTVHRVLVYALGLKDEADGLEAIHSANGYSFATPKKFGTLLIGMRLGLRYNHSDESLDVGPDTPLPRAEVAWSLYRAKTLASWQIDAMAPYASIELPFLGPKLREVVQWGIRYVGYPYVWGGEWRSKSPAGYAFGSQPIGGFDCSGITWWAIKRAEGGWDNSPPRPYGGWSLPQRTSADMARYGNVGFRRLVPGDLMFYDGNADGTVDHVDTFLGNGWSLDSGSSNAGVTITFTGKGSWYDDHFVHGRHVIKT